MVRRSVFTTAPEPSTWATGRDIPNLRLRNHAEGCGCGQPTRDHAYACDDCASELTRFLADAPWLAEQLDITITGQRGKRPGQSGRASDGLPWNTKASNVLRALHAHLITTVNLCEAEHIRHQSPYTGLPANTPETLSRWLLWRVDGLMFTKNFTDTLRYALAVEKKALAVIDRQPDRMFLGMCELARLKLCDGAVYVKAGDTIGKCRTCGMKYDAEDRRAALEAALDDQLCTAAEIAKLATYLGIQAPRDTVRKSVNRWHNRKQLTPKLIDPDGSPRFRYGDVAPLLSALYDKKEATR